MPETSVILDKPWQIQLFGYAQLLGRLKVENNTRLKFSNSHLGTTLQAANHVMGTNFRSKKKAEEEFRKRLNDLHRMMGLEDTLL